MQKIKRGKSFAGVVQYALKPGAHHKSDPIVIGGNMLGDSASELIAEFDGTKQLRQMFRNRYGTTRFAYLMVNHYRMTNG
jgi:hypothetical protein